MTKQLLVILVTLALIFSGEFTIPEAYAKSVHTTPRAKSTTARPAKTAVRSKRGVSRSSSYKSRTARTPRGRASPAQNFRTTKMKWKTNTGKNKGISARKASVRSSSSTKRTTLSFSSKDILKRAKSAKLREQNIRRAKREKIWKLPPTQRGNYIENRLAKTEYKKWYYVGATRKGKFPLVDFHKGKTLVSLKTVDTRGSRWKKDMRKHINDLATRKASIGNREARMMLDLRVRQGQRKDAYHLIAYGKHQGVVVRIREY